jgi:caffeoyl-CoA O-methyltransferase
VSRVSVAKPEVADYVVAHSTRPDAIQRALIEATSEKVGTMSIMQIGQDQGAFMSILAATMQPKFAVEVGTFTGYSALCIARGLAPGGRLLCCDISGEWASIGRPHWEAAGVADQIDLQLAPALETLQALPAEPPIDFAFIDADKGGYQGYYDEILARLSPRGVILIDNTLWSGAVLPDSGAEDDDTIALRKLNDFIAADERVEVVQLTVGDGITMVRRRG